MAVERDHFDQLDREFTERDYNLLAILEEVASPDERPDRTLSAYLADILDLFHVE